MSNIILIGFMGCGKTSVGSVIGTKLGRTFTDTDKWIEEKHGIIKDIFMDKGELYFRELETDAIRYFMEHTKDAVISVGGGLPITEGNGDLLRELGTVIYLKASQDTLYNRLKNDRSRPLLAAGTKEEKKDKLEKLYSYRAPIYESLSHVIVTVDNRTISQIADEIIAILVQEKGGCKA